MDSERAALRLRLARAAAVAERMTRHDGLVIAVLVGLVLFAVVMALAEMVGA